MEAQDRGCGDDPGSTGTSLKNRVKTKENHVPQSRFLVPESANQLLSKLSVVGLAVGASAWSPPPALSATSYWVMARAAITR
ncbi:hypothetical protein EYF80_011826 [Liparis tanakae]|uniref:Uncharacterized protein n=1 Tax=Liparis tanakae TaxID=230148 RepID=A0A4Z2IL41_9TELE|nr:hypothetical protein EYF80_011826 [Liparis tanakae]